MSLEKRMKLNSPLATESTTITAYYTVNIDHHSKKPAEPISCTKIIDAITYRICIQ